MNDETNKFQRKTYTVEAIRVTRHNYKQIATSVKGEFVEGSPGGPYVKFLEDVAFSGDWVVRFEDGRYETFAHEDFVRNYQTHDEREKKDEKYAKIYGLVKAAMIKQDTATYHGESSAGMDLVAIQTTQKILDEL